MTREVRIHEIKEQFTEVFSEKIWACFLDACWCQGVYPKSKESLSQCVITSFDWMKTKEGTDFWEEVYDFACFYEEWQKE